MFFRSPEPDIETSDATLTPEQQRVIAKVRRLSTMSVLVMVLGLAAVFGVIGYRMMRDKGANPGEITATLPRDAQVVGTAVSGDLLVLTLKVGDAIEIRTFRLGTLTPAGRLRFAAEP